MLEGTDEAEVVVFETFRGVFETVVEERVRAGVFHEGLESRAGMGVSFLIYMMRWGRERETYSSAQREIGSAMTDGRV